MQLGKLNFGVANATSRRLFILTSDENSAETEPHPYTAHGANGETLQTQNTSEKWGVSTHVAKASNDDLVWLH